MPRLICVPLGAIAPNNPHKVLSSATTVGKHIDRYVAAIDNAGWEVAAFPIPHTLQVYTIWSGSQAKRAETWPQLQIPARCHRVVLVTHSDGAVAELGVP